MEKAQENMETLGMLEARNVSSWPSLKLEGFVAE